MIWYWRHVYRILFEFQDCNLTSWMPSNVMADHSISIQSNEQNHKKSIFCHTMPCFCVIYRSTLDITPVAHYFLWILPLCTLHLCSMTHYDITMGNDVDRDAHCNITMGNDIARDIHCDVIVSNGVAICTSQCIITLSWTSFVMYYQTHLMYCYFTTKLFTIVHINH